MRTRAFLACLAVCASVLRANPVGPIAPNAVTDKLRTLDPENERLAGVFATRLRANSEGLLEHADLPALLAPYDSGTAKQSGSKSRGELAGRYLLASAHAYEYRREPELKASMDRVVTVLARAQGSDGYLGVSASDDRFNSQDLRVQRANLLGLLTYYQVTGEEAAYLAAQKIGDLLVKQLKREIPNDAENKFVAAALGQPLVLLYQYTAEPDYLALAKALVPAADPAAKTEENVTFLAERLNALGSAAELYRATGDAAYLRQAVNGWTGIAENQLSVTGVPNAGGDSDNCVTAAWLQLTLKLLQITGGAKFADNLELTIYNHLLAGQDATGGDVCETTAVSGKKRFLNHAMASVSPCALAEADGISLIARSLWGRAQDGIAINFYNPGRGTFQLRRRALVQVYLESSYPANGDILLHVEPSRHARFLLRLRVPEWAENFSADFGRSHLLGKPGEYLVLERQWQRGDTVKISITAKPRLIPKPDSDSSLSALKKGPEILVLSRMLNPKLKNLGAAAPVLPLAMKLSDDKRLSVGEEAYEVEGRSDGKPQPLIFIPFADAVDSAMWFEKPASP